MPVHNGARVDLGSGHCSTAFSTDIAMPLKVIQATRDKRPIRVSYYSRTGLHGLLSKDSNEKWSELLNRFEEISAIFVSPNKSQADVQQSYCAALWETGNQPPVTAQWRHNTAVFRRHLGSFRKWRVGVRTGFDPAGGFFWKETFGVTYRHCGAVIERL